LTVGITLHLLSNYAIAKPKLTGAVVPVDGEMTL